MFGESVAGALIDRTELPGRHHTTASHTIGIPQLTTLLEHLPSASRLEDYRDAVVTDTPCAETSARTDGNRAPTAKTPASISCASGSLPSLRSPSRKPGSASNRSAHGAPAARDTARPVFGET